MRPLDVDHCKGVCVLVFYTYRQSLLPGAETLKSFPTIQSYDFSDVMSRHSNQ